MALPKLLNKNLNTYVLAGLLSLFIVFDIQIPDIVANLVNNFIGKIVIIIVSLSLLNTHPLVGSLGIIAAYFLIKRSERNNSVMVDRFVPSEKKKSVELQKYNIESISLEETVIKNQIPFSRNRKNLSGGATPLDSAIHDAAEV